MTGSRSAAAPLTNVLQQIALICCFTSLEGIRESVGKGLLVPIRLKVNRFGLVIFGLQPGLFNRMQSRLAGAANHAAPVAASLAAPIAVPLGAPMALLHTAGMAASVANGPAAVSMVLSTMLNMLQNVSHAATTVSAVSAAATAL